MKNTNNFIHEYLTNLYENLFPSRLKPSGQLYLGTIWWFPLTEAFKVRPEDIERMDEEFRKSIALSKIPITPWIFD
jgi:hypothetical protein